MLAVPVGTGEALTVVAVAALSAVAAAALEKFADRVYHAREAGGAR